MRDIDVQHNYGLLVQVSAEDWGRTKENFAKFAGEAETNVEVLLQIGGSKREMTFEEFEKFVRGE